MVSESSVFFTPWMMFLLAIFIVGTVIIALTIVERRLNQKIILRKQEENSYTNRIRKILQTEKNPQQSIFMIDGLAREFIAEKFQLDASVKYSEFIEEFRKKNNGEIVRFCERMQEALYSGEALNSKKIEFLSKNLIFLMNKEEKKEAERRKLERRKNLFERILEEKKLAKKKSPEQWNQEVDMRLAAYLEEGLKRGFKTELLKEQLLRGGFEEGDVMRVILRYQPEEEKLKKTEIIQIKTPYENQKNDAPPRLESRGLFGARFLDARERPHLERCGFQRSRHKQRINADFNSAKNVSFYSRLKRFFGIGHETAVETGRIIPRTDVRETREIAVAPLKTQPAEQNAVNLQKAALSETAKPEEKIQERKLTAETKKPEPAVLKPLKVGVQEPEKASWFSRLFKQKEKKEPVVNLKILEILSESKKRGFDMGLVMEKLAVKGFDKEEIEFAMKRLELMTGEKKVEVKGKPETIAALPVGEKDTKEAIEVVPYKKEEIKHRTVKVGRELKTDKFIEGTDNFDRIKGKIAERKNVWASRVVYENKGGLV